MIRRLVPVLAFALFTSCSMDTPPDDPPAEESAETDAERTDDDMVGLTRKEAEALASERGLKSRVVSVDGDVRPVTMDYLTDRVNFTIEGGIVVQVTRG